MSIGTFTREYEAWLIASGLAANTIRQRVQFAERWVREWGTLAGVDQTDVARWLAGYTGWTRRTYHNHLKSLFDWLVATEQVEENHVANIRGTKVPRLRANPLPPDELQLVLGTARGDLRTWLLLGYLAGFRLHEMAKVRGEDVTRSHIRIAGKGGVVDQVPTHDVIWELATTRYPRRGYWFPSRVAGSEHISAGYLSSIIRAHVRALGVEDGAAHRLRHTYCTTLARNGVPAHVIQSLMRHSLLNTTQGYIATDEAALAAGISTLQVGPMIPHPGASLAA